MKQRRDGDVKAEVLIVAYGAVGQVGASVESRDRWLLRRVSPRGLSGPEIVAALSPNGH